MATKRIVSHRLAPLRCEWKKADNWFNWKEGCEEFVEEIKAPPADGGVRESKDKGCKGEIHLKIMQAIKGLSPFKKKK